MENLVVKAITAFLITTILSASGCAINKQNKLADMVKAGTDPQKAACAIYFGETNSETSVCTILSLKEIK